MILLESLKKEKRWQSTKFVHKFPTKVFNSLQKKTGARMER